MKTTVFARHGEEHKMLVTSWNARDVYRRAIKKRRVKWNYMVTARDSSGGCIVSLAVVDWVEPGDFYIN